MPKLVLPSVKYKKSFLEDYLRRTGKTMKESYEMTAIPKKELSKDFAGFVTRLKLQRHGKYLKKGYVPQTVFWLVQGKKFIGDAGLRHKLSPFLKRIGGHIGYYIRPKERQKGYGTLILKLVLPKAKSIGIKKVLLTCDETNIGSKKIIEANSGKLINRVKQGKGLPYKLRYWIKTS